MIVWSTTTTQAGNASDLPIVQKWSGDFPVAHLDRLPQGKSKAGAGYIDDKSLFECLNNYYRFSDLYMGAK